MKRLLTKQVDRLMRQWFTPAAIRRAPRRLVRKWRANARWALTGAPKGGVTSVCLTDEHGKPEEPSR